MMRRHMLRDIGCIISGIDLAYVYSHHDIKQWICIFANIISMVGEFSVLFPTYIHVAGSKNVLQQDF